MIRWLPLWVLLCTGCATAKLAQANSVFPPDPGVARNVVLEPLFELADWKTTTRTEYAQLSPNSYGGYGGYGTGFGSPAFGGTVPITTQVAEKPLLARPPILAEIHRLLLLEVQRRRPSWRVTSTGGVNLLSGQATVVRTIIEGTEVIASDRTLKGLLLGVGVVLWPLLYFAAQPVEETERVLGLVERFTTSADTLQGRLVRYPTQPDYAINLAGVPPLRRNFGLDVTYAEGVMANEGPRQGVLIAGFVDRLATAVIAVVEEPAPATPPPASPPPASPP